MSATDITSVEQSLADLEKGEAAFLFPSGISAMSVLLDLLDHGAHVIVSEDVSYATYRLFENVRHRTSNMRFSFVDASDVGAIEGAIDKQSKMIWLEVPFLRHGKMPDFESIAELAKSRELLSVTDHSALTGATLNPLDRGIDIAIYSDPTNLVGKTGARGGAVVIGPGRDMQIDKVEYLRNALGQLPYDEDARIIAGALNDLEDRVLRQTETAKRIAAALTAHDGVAVVNFSGIGPGLAFDIKGGLSEANAIMASLDLFKMQVGPGGQESHIEHPATMSHGSIPAIIRRELGISDSLMFLYAGLENPDDLIADLLAAFDHSL